MEERLKLTEEQERWLKVMVEAYEKFEAAGGRMLIHDETEECFAFNGKQVECMDYLYDEEEEEEQLEVMDDKMDDFNVSLWIPLWRCTKSLGMRFKSNN